MSAAPNRRLVAVVLLVPAVVALALWAFAWPAARMAPRELPVGVAGSAPAADQLQRQLEERVGAFEVHRYDSEGAARTAIQDRAVYGAVVATAKGPELLTASAAGPVVAQLLHDALTASSRPALRCRSRTWWRRRPRIRAAVCSARASCRWPSRAWPPARP